MMKFYYQLQGWFRHHINKYKFKLVKEAFTGKPYDWAFLLELEKAKLKEMLNYFENDIISKSYFDHEHDIRYIRLCIKLIDIICTGGGEDDDCIKTNCKNARRFIEPKTIISGDKLIDFCKKYPHHLRTAKATQLYYEIRKRYTTDWWN